MARHLEHLYVVTYISNIGFTNKIAAFSCFTTAVNVNFLLNAHHINCFNGNLHFFNHTLIYLFQSDYNKNIYLGLYIFRIKNIYINSKYINPI